MPREENEFADLTDLQQINLLESAPNGGSTDNSLTSQPLGGVGQPPQDPEWEPEETEAWLL